MQIMKSSMAWRKEKEEETTGLIEFQTSAPEIFMYNLSPKYDMQMRLQPMRTWGTVVRAALCIVAGTGILART